MRESNITRRNESPCNWATASSSSDALYRPLMLNPFLNLFFTYVHICPSPLVYSPSKIKLKNSFFLKVLLPHNKVK